MSVDYTYFARKFNDYSMKTKVLFVCLGNICRSPMAEGLFINKVHSLGIQDEFTIDSAGTAGYHAGGLPDQRMRETAKRRGIELRSRARQILPSDLLEFDIILAMDDSNYDNILQLSNGNHHAEIIKMGKFFDESEPDVPDPYYGGQKGFEDVFDMLDKSCDNLLEYINTHKN